VDKHLILPATVWDPGVHLFSQCVAVTGAHQTLYLAGQTSIDADGTIVGVDDVEFQIRFSFANIAAIVAAAGGTLDNVVKLTAYFVDMAALDIYTQILGELFPVMRPAQTVVQVVRLAMPELLIELDATAVI
jgi:enamine deaminase RidA (YjgF/YER057c/UK114 family)